MSVNAATSASSMPGGAASDDGIAHSGTIRDGNTRPLSR